jgi:hypothetical protein
VTHCGAQGAFDPYHEKLARFPTGERARLSARRTFQIIESHIVQRLTGGGGSALQSINATKLVTVWKT